MSVKIDQAFVSAFIAGAYGLPIAHENFDFTPVSGTAYAELKVAQNIEAPLSLTDSNDTTGAFLVTLRYPLDSGSIAIKTMADTIGLDFKIATVISYAGQSVKVNRHGRDVGVAEDGWYKIILTFQYWAYVAR
tara:strand:+ start:449 stop:847 length:399 start_codon:yes stop_codon:yes gene_type:complete